MIADATRKLIRREDLSAEESRLAVEAIMSGGVSPSLVAAFLTAMRMKGETPEEVYGAAQTMRDRVTRIAHNQPVLLDNCGTGGDGAGTFNISTTAAFVLAGAGVAVGKHGNRCISSRSGSADVLQALGVRIDLTPVQVSRCIDDIGIGFMFAPLLHPAMKAVAPVRRELGFRTLFNLLGPLTNPAFATHQVVGVFDPAYTEIVAEAAASLGGKRAYAVHNEIGIDELATTGLNRVSIFEDGELRTFTIDPTEFGFGVCRPQDLAGGAAHDNAAITLDVLGGIAGPALDTVVMNAALGFVAVELVSSFREGLSLAKNTIKDGRALRKLNEFVDYTCGLQHVA